MDVQKLKEAMEKLKGDMGNALLTSDIVMQKDGQALVSHNPNPKLCALGTLMVKQIVDITKKAEVKLGNKLMLKLSNNQALIVLYQGDYIWGSIFDESKIQIGLVVNAIVPDALKNLKEAISS